jgi:tripartite-type tricarboxylate transporter receptor subunit TctC
MIESKLSFGALLDSLSKAARPLSRPGLRACRRLFAPAVALVLACTLAGPAGAAGAWPSQPLRVIVPFPAGGTTDIVARVLSQKLGQMWNQTIVIENRSGAGGAIGAVAVAQAAPDGYTLLLTSGSVLTVNPFIYPTLAYRVKDFAMITNVASGPMVVVINPKLPAKTLREFIDYVKARPGKVNVGSAGVGSQTHMAAEAVGDAAGLKWTHVPYKGETLAYNDIMAGQIDAVVGNIAAVSSFVKSGKIRGLAVTGPARSPLLPELPTTTEAGLPGVDVEGWFGLIAPKGTPTAILEKINHDTRQVLADPNVNATLTAQGMVPVGDSAAHMLAAVEKESLMWKRIVAERHLVAQ